MFSGLLLPVALFLYPVVADTDNKRWTWSSNGRSHDREDEIIYTGVASSKGYTAALVSPPKSLFQPSSIFEDSYASSSSKQRYQVSESGNFPTPQSRPPIYPQQQYQPTTSTINGYQPNGHGSINRPNSGHRPPLNNYRPTDNFRPGLGNGYRPSGGSYRPTEGPDGRPILTGPVPSWVQRDDERYRHYDKCKCVHSFNCNTPGIKFGTCDLDKQYCCYKDLDSHQHAGLDLVNRPTRPILAGPDGPVDRPGLYRPVNLNRFERLDDNYFGSDRYSKDFRDSNFGLEDAYRRGLELVIHESIQSPNRPFGPRRNNYRQNSNSDINRRPYGGKYGLYKAADSYNIGRSANATISAEKEMESRSKS